MGSLSPQLDVVVKTGVASIELASPYMFSSIGLALGTHGSG